MVNLTLACDNCNRLKSNLTAGDFAQILEDPDAFFARVPRFRSRRAQLLDFAALAMPRYQGLDWIGGRFGTPRPEWRRKWEELRSAYRVKWLILVT